MRDTQEDGEYKKVGYNDSRGVLGNFSEARRERKSPEPSSFCHHYCNTQQVGGKQGGIDNVARAAKYSLRWGSLGGAVVWRLPLAQGAILETRDRIPHRASGAWSLLLPLSLSLSLSVTIINK